MQIASDSGLITWLPRHTGVFAVAVSVADSEGLSSKQGYNITVGMNDTVSVPELSPVGNQTAPLGNTLRLRLTTIGITDRATLRYHLAPIPIPANMRLDSATGAYSFTPSLAQVGEHELTFIVSNGRFSDRETISITVPRHQATQGYEDKS
jgi:hypothetical protein